MTDCACVCFGMFLFVMNVDSATHNLCCVRLSGVYSRVFFEFTASFSLKTNCECCCRTYNVPFNAHVNMILRIRNKDVVRSTHFDGVYFPTENPTQNRSDKCISIYDVIKLFAKSFGIGIYALWYLSNVLYHRWQFFFNNNTKYNQGLICIESSRKYTNTFVCKSLNLLIQDTL